MMKKISSLIFLLFCIKSIFAQVDSTQYLKPVLLSDNQLKDFSVGQTLNELNDSIIDLNQASLTSLLNYNTPIYFKENGLGMVSSPSFRGTTAQQTAVLWNGININSTFLGQTDFNTINIGSFDQISVRAGGGSMLYGSGAIGGTVHLNTQLKFDGKTQHKANLKYGSFNTVDMRYRLRMSSRNWSFRFSAAYNQSDNDFKLHKRKGKNLNGQFHNLALNTALGFKLNAKNQINLYSALYDGERHFAVIRPSENKTKYDDLNTRNLLEWRSYFGKFKSALKTAFLSENYKYFPNIKYHNHSYGKAETLIGKYNLRYKPINNIWIETLLSHEHTNGFGTDIRHEVRNISAVGLLFKHKLSSKIRYQLGGKKELTNSYESPVLYSFGFEYQPVSYYILKISQSKNFRRPTYNDLYWQDSGDPDLKAEASQQVELGNTLKFKNWKLTLTGFYNDIDQMIHWLPAANGTSKPFNIDHVNTYGTEILLNWERHFGFQFVSLNGTYAYTISKNMKTHKQLIYVPYHKATFSAIYGLNRFAIDYQFLLNGEVYTRTDNDSTYNLGGYALSNVGVSYEVGKKKNYKVGARIYNLFDKVYENVQSREMPGIYYNFYLTLNF